MKMCKQQYEAKSKTPPLLRRVLVVCSFLFFAGLWGACSMAPSVSVPTDGGNVGIGLCETNTDCLGGMLCVNRYCKSPGGLPGAQIVSLHVLPPSTHRYSNEKTVVVKQQFLGIDASKIHDKSIFLRPAYLIAGRIHVTTKEKTVDGKPKYGKPVAARVRFLDLESIAGTPIEVTAESGVDGVFRARLTHGLYDVEITPLDGKHPPHRINKIKVERDGDLVLTIPEEDDYPRLTASIVTPGVRSVPIAGLRVQVFSATNKQISSVATTDAKGVFHLWLSAKERPHRIRIHMRPHVREDKEHKIKAVDAHPQVDVPFAPTVLSVGEKIDLGPLKVGWAPSELLEVGGSVHATEQHAGGQPLKGCEVHIVGTIDLKASYKDQPIIGYYRISTTTKEGGLFGAFVLPGSYQIEVLPPFESRELWARASVQKENFFNSDREIKIHLQPKPKLTGRICQKGDKGQCIRDVAKAQIQAVWRGSLSKPADLDKRPPIPVPETPSQLSDSQGWYSLPLDPGIYDLIFVPPIDSGLARRIRFNVRVEASKLPDFNAYLTSANHLAGVILGPDRFPIPNTVIEMYSHPHNPKEPVRLLGRATTNYSGKYSLAYNLPNQY